MYLTEAGLGRARCRGRRAPGGRARGGAARRRRRCAPAAGDPAERSARRFYPGDAHIDSLRYVQRVAEGAQTARRPRARGRRGASGAGARPELRVETTGGAIAARQLVLAAGVLVAPAGADLDVITAARGRQGLPRRVRRPRAARSDSPCSWHETRVVVTPLEGRLRLAGTLELGTDPEALGARRVDAVARGRRAPRRRPGRRPITQRLARPAADDARRHAHRRPRARRRSRDPVATGHGMLGITLAPLTGEHVATLARGLELGSDLAPLRPERFRRVPRLHGGLIHSETCAGCTVRSTTPARRPLTVSSSIASRSVRVNASTTSSAS